VSISSLIIPILIVALLLFGIYKKLNVYHCFVGGARQSVNLVVTIFPYLVAIFCAIELMKASGLDSVISVVLSPVFKFCGIPSELCELIIIRPFTGSGSLALLESIYTQYGTDSYISRCASTIVACSDSIFYIATIYFSGTNIRRIPYAIAISLFVTFLSFIVSCWLCRIM